MELERPPRGNQWNFRYEPQNRNIFTRCVRENYDNNSRNHDAFVM